MIYTFSLDMERILIEGIRVFIITATGIENREAQFKETTRLSATSEKASPFKSKKRFNRYNWNKNSTNNFQLYYNIR